MSLITDTNTEACTSSAASTSSRSSSAKYSKNAGANYSSQGVKIIKYQKGTSSNPKVIHVSQRANDTRSTSNIIDDADDVNLHLNKNIKSFDLKENNNTNNVETTLNDSQTIKICMNKNIFPNDCLKFSKKKDQIEKKLEKELNKTGPQLPMVKFDSDGDFFKEPFDCKCLLSLPLLSYRFFIFDLFLI